ncbi:MAG TPA: helix-turn-helix domain-containing protein, partial [Pseudomonadales bacterium]|nr:helix-turn-helix domain-containing protein [Pseudomonadales bacterium]
KYGEAFLDILREYANVSVNQTTHTDGILSSTSHESLALFQSGLSISAISARRNLKENTVYKHLAEAIALGLLRVSEVLELPEQQIRLIQDVLRSHRNAEGYIPLGPAYESLDKIYSFDQLHCVRAGLQG